MAKNKERFASSVNIRNKRASYEYEFLDTYTAGIVLTGTEIKSIREGKVSLGESYCYFNGHELFVKGMHISPYKQGTHFNHEPARERKLLLHKKELRKLKQRSEEKGLTIIPVRIFTNERGFAKLEIALARGKKLHDKRQALKEKDLQREIRQTY